VLGKGKLAIKVAQWFYNHKEYELLLIVPVIPEPNWTTSISEWAAKNKIPIVKSGHYKDIPFDIKIDLAISVTYDKIIKKSFCKMTFW
jgi:hypothetical protein